jgi:type VI secretion system secreted protein Hcp
MAVDAFVQFGKGGAAGVDIDGETLDREMSKMKPRPFDITDWSFSISQKVNMGSASGGAGAGKVEFDEFNITKTVDKSSPSFLAALCTGSHFETVTLMMRKAGAAKGASGAIFLKFDFKMVFCTGVDWAHDEEAPTETLTFQYGALQVTYKKQNKDGSLGADQTGSWSRVLNSKTFDVL